MGQKMLTLPKHPVSLLVLVEVSFCTFAFFYLMLVLLSLFFFASGLSLYSEYLFKLCILHLSYEHIYNTCICILSENIKFIFTSSIMLQHFQLYIYNRYLHLMLSVCKCISWSIDDGNFKSLLRSKFKTCEKD